MPAVLTESAALRLVFTVSRQFYIYRLGDGAVLEVVPKIGEFLQRLPLA